MKRQRIKCCPILHVLFWIRFHLIDDDECFWMASSYLHFPCLHVTESIMFHSSIRLCIFTRSWIGYSTTTFASTSNSWPIISHFHVNARTTAAALNPALSAVSSSGRWHCQSLLTLVDQTEKSRVPKESNWAAWKWERWGFLHQGFSPFVTSIFPAATFFWRVTRLWSNIEFLTD